MDDQPSRPLIAEPQQLYKVLRHLDDTKDALIWWSEARTFRIVLRTTPDDDDDDDRKNDGTPIAAELCCYAGLEGASDEPDDIDAERDRQLILRRALNLEADGYWCDSAADHWVVGSYNVLPPDNASEENELMKCLEDVNALHTWSWCPCGTRILKDPHKEEMCCFCTLTSRKEDRASVFCGICNDKVAKMHAHTMRCCGQALKKTCLEEWKRSAKRSGKSFYQCPFCRAEFIL